jgi:hypothetical protein
MQSFEDLIRFERRPEENLASFLEVCDLIEIKTRAQLA